MSGPADVALRMLYLAVQHPDAHAQALEILGELRSKDESNEPLSLDGDS
jgi:hypothetical protein